MLKVGSKTLGIGTDIIHLPRFKRLLEKYPLRTGIDEPKSFLRIAKKFMHPHELTKLQAMAHKPYDETHVAIYTAGIWGIKESVLKALACYVPSDEMPTAQCVYTRLVYRSSSRGQRPTIQFDDTFRSKASHSDAAFYDRYIDTLSTKPLVSISHDGDYLVTFACLVEGEEDKTGD